MKKIVITPAGRKKYLEILYLNLLKCKDEFDTWSIWINTWNEEDIEYIELLEKTNDWITTAKLEGPTDVDTESFSDREVAKPQGDLSHVDTATHFQFYTSWWIHKFIQQELNDPETVYLRLDDDIVFIEKGAIEKILEERIKNTDCILVHANTINNSVIQYNTQNLGIYQDFEKFGNHCMAQNTWNNPEHAEKLHRLFIEKYLSKDIESLYTEDFSIDDFTRTSVNAVSLRGDMYNLYKDVWYEEEEYQSRELPLKINIPNRVCGSSIIVHFAFFPQAAHLLETDILDIYKIISMKDLKDRAN